MASRKKRLSILLIIVLLMGAGYYVYTNWMTPKKELKTLKLYGNVDIREVALAFFATGRVTRLLVEEGQKVNAGDLLAEIDSSRYEAELARLKAELAAFKEDLQMKETGSRPQRIREARAAVAAAAARLKEADVSYGRFRALWKSRAVAKQKLDDAEMLYRTAKADLKQARQALSLALEGPRIESIAAARATVEAAEAAVALAKEKLADTKVYSPADGVIQKRILEVGDMAFPNTPVYTIALMEPIWVRAYLPEPFLGKIMPEFRADIITDSFPEKTYAGWVGYISPTAEFTPKQVQTEELRTKLVYQTRIYACNPKGELRLGMPVTISIPLDQSPAHLKNAEKRLCDGAGYER